MAKDITTDEWRAALVAAIGIEPEAEGFTVKELREQLGLSVSMRTMQNRVQRAVEEGRMVRTGTRMVEVPSGGRRRVSVYRATDTPPVGDNRSHGHHRSQGETR